MLLLYILFLSLGSCEMAREPHEASLGRGFFLKEKNLFGIFQDGAQVFKDLPDNCFKRHQQFDSESDTHFYETTDEVYDLIKSETGLAGSLSGGKTITATIDAITQHLTASETHVSGLSLVMLNTQTMTDMTQDCLTRNPLSDSLLQDFRSLPETIEDPRYAISWKDYDTFLKKYGSHVIEKQEHGSRIRHYTFAKSSHKYTQREFLVKGCLDFAGYTNYGQINVSACSSITDEEIHKDKCMSVTNQLSILGGTSETRQRLLVDITPENIRQFLASANSSDQAIGNQFLPSWRILNFHGLNERVTENLRAYYEGYLDFGCEYRSKSGMVLQEFVTIGPSIRNINRYVCRIPPLGCQDDAGCHVLGYTWGLKCGCYGKGCVKWTREDRIPNPEDVYRADIREWTDDLTWYDPPSSTCLYHVGYWCTCEQDRPYRVQWDSYSENGLQQAQYPTLLAKQEQEEATSAEPMSFRQYLLSKPLPRW